MCARVREKATEKSATKKAFIQTKDLEFSNLKNKGIYSLIYNWVILRGLSFFFWVNVMKSSKFSV